MTVQHLATVIDFAVVMLGASLLITIFTQTVSGLFAYRGSNLRWGLQTLFRHVNPRLTCQASRALAENVLTHPILSDSSLSHFADVPVLGPATRRWRLASAIRVE